MFIRNLYIKDFKNIKEVNFSFDKINVISGNTGQGKTAVIQALTFLLCNYLDDNINEFVRWGKAQFIIRIVFSHLNNNYEYEIIGGKATKRKLIINSEEELLQSDTYKYLFDILDPTLTLYSNISLQHNTTGLLFEKKTLRLEKFKQIIGVDKLNILGEKIKEDKKKYENDIEKMKTEIAVFESCIFEFEEEPIFEEIDIERKEQDFKKLELDKEIYQKELQNYASYKEKLSVYENSIIEITNLEKKKKNIKQKLEENNNNISDETFYDLENHNVLKNNLNTYEKEFLQLENEINTFKNYKKLKDEYETSISSKRDELEKIKLNRLPRLKFSVSDLEKQEVVKQELLFNYSKIEDKYNDLKSGQCPICGTGFEVESLDKIKENIVIKKKIYDDYEKEYNNNKKILEDYNKLKIENDITQQKIQLINTEIYEFENKIENLEKKDEPDYSRNKYLLEEITKLEKDLIDLEKKSKLYYKIKKENMTIIEEISNLKNEIKNIDSKVEVYKQVKKPGEFVFTINFDEAEYQNLKLEIQNYRELESELLRIQKVNNKIKKEKRENRSKITKKEKDIFNLRSEISILNEVHKILTKEFASHLIDNASIFLKEKMNDFFQRAYHGKYHVIFQRDGNGIDYFYSEDNETYHSVQMLSGFEKELFATAQRVALTSLGNLNIFIADEIDANASTEKSLDLYSALTKEKFDQLFLITHVDETKEFLSNFSNSKVFEINEGEIK